MVDRNQGLLLAVGSTDRLEDFQSDTHLVSFLPGAYFGLATSKTCSLLSRNFITAAPLARSNAQASVA